MRRISNRCLRKVLLLVFMTVLSTYMLVFVSIDDESSNITQNGRAIIEETTICQTEDLVENVTDNCSDKFCFRHLTKCVLKDNIVTTKSECRFKRFLVYKCDVLQCGGWGDRLKGIVSTFLLALLTGRVFVLDMKQPCALDTFLDYRVYDWSICVDYVNSVPHPYSLDTFSSTGELGKNISNIVSLNEPIVVLYLRLNLINKITKYQNFTNRLLWTKDLEGHEIAHIVLHTLFKEGQALKESREYMLKNTGYRKKLACAHIRTGKNPSNPADTIAYNGIGNRELRTIFSFLKTSSKDGEYSVYIASDSDTVKRVASKTYKMHTLNRTFIHIDLPVQGRFSAEVCDGFSTVLLEHYFLSQCDILLLTRSNFGLTAAYMRGSNEGLFVLSHQNNILGNGIVPIQLADLQRVFNFK